MSSRSINLAPRQREQRSSRHLPGRALRPFGSMMDRPALSEQTEPSPDLATPGPKSREGVRRRMEERDPISPPRGLPQSHQARTLTNEQLEQVLGYIHQNANSPFSDEAKVLLSFYAGLRACEIASLTMDDVCDASGEVGNFIVVQAANAKNKQRRSIPMHPRLRSALIRLKTAHPRVPFVAFSNYGKIKKQSTSAVTVWFSRLYRHVGFAGCSSHSGRRTFITHLARNANQHNKSLRDVQVLAGHARLDTTERYIDPSENLSGLVASL